MKILFIVPQSLNPKQTYLEYPMGVGFIGTILSKMGHNVRIIDQNAEQMSVQDVCLETVKQNPDMIGFSIITPTYPVAVRIMKQLNINRLKIPIIFGGYHATLFPEYMFEIGGDAVILGEGEEIFPKLVTCYDSCGKLLMHNRIKISPYTTFKCTIFQSDSVHPNDILNRDLFNLSLYPHHSLLAARGCPFNCKFCCNYRNIIGPVRIRSIKSVITELQLLENKYKANEVFFVDDIFFLTRENILAFCQEYLNAKLSIKWVAQLRVNTVDEDAALAMKKAGCQRVYFGAESGSQFILDAANKMINVEDIIKGITVAKNAGLRVKTGWIYGLPGNIDEQRKTIDVILATHPHEVSIHQLIPFPGTDYYNNPTRYGIMIKDKNDFSSFCYGGFGDNISYTYMTKVQYWDLLQETITRLEKDGYINNDIAEENSNFIYTLPISKNSIKVFK